MNYKTILKTIAILGGLGFIGGCASHARSPEPVKQTDVARKLGFPNDSSSFLEQIASLPGGYQTRWPLVRHMDEIAAIYSGNIQVEEVNIAGGGSFYAFYLIKEGNKIPRQQYTPADVAEASTQEMKSRVYGEADANGDKILSRDEVDNLWARVIPKYAGSKK